jgi:hypothetical protein
MGWPAYAEDRAGRAADNNCCWAAEAALLCVHRTAVLTSCLVGWEQGG